MSYQESHLLCCHVLRGNDEVTFVFAIRRVQYDDELTISKSCYGLSDAVEATLRHAIDGHADSSIKH